MLDDGYDAQLSVCLPYIGEWLVACGFVCVYGYRFVCGFDTLLIFTLVFGFNLCLMEGGFPVKIVEGG